MSKAEFIKTDSNILPQSFIGIKRKLYTIYQSLNRYNFIPTF